MDGQVMAKIAAAAAEAGAMEKSLTMLGHGCRLFDVPQGWESAAIRHDKGVRVCDTLLSLEEAVKDGDVKVIFIPADAMITLEGIERVCQRNAAVKTLFREVKKG